MAQHVGKQWHTQLVQLGLIGWEEEVSWGGVGRKGESHYPNTEKGKRSKLLSAAWICQLGFHWEEIQCHSHSLESYFSKTNLQCSAPASFYCPGITRCSAGHCQNRKWQRQLIPQLILNSRFTLSNYTKNTQTCWGRENWGRGCNFKPGPHIGNDILAFIALMTHIMPLYVSRADTIRLILQKGRQ